VCDGGGLDRYADHYYWKSVINAKGGETVVKLITRLSCSALFCLGLYLMMMSMGEIRGYGARAFTYGGVMGALMGRDLTGLMLGIISHIRLRQGVIISLRGIGLTGLETILILMLRRRRGNVTVVRVGGTVRLVAVKEII